MGLSEAYPFLARLLFHQQTHVAGHQVDTSTQSQCLADKRGFQQCLVAVVFVEQHVYCLADVVHLVQGIRLELGRIEVFAGAELQGLFAERGAKHVAEVCRWVVYNLVQRRTCKVT